jgi:SH3-like domain-containing protein
MREGPESGARLLWRVEAGVVGALRDCKDGWCRFEIGQRKGWMPAARLWGAGTP